MTLEEAVRLISETLGTNLSIDSKQVANHVCIGSIGNRQIYGPKDKASIMTLLEALSIDQASIPFLATSREWLNALSDVGTALPKSPSLPQNGRLLALSPVSPNNLTLILDILSMQLAAQALYYEDNRLVTLVPEEDQLRDGILALSETLFFEVDAHSNLLLSQRFENAPQVKLAHQSLILMLDAIEKGLLQSPVIFDEVTTNLLMHEWLSSEIGPVSKAILNESLFTQIDEEVEKTAEMLFKMNLNLTDTAKALFIHRNTLIYRLDKIQKQFGLDLRHFEDAFQLKLILSLVKHHK